MKGSRQGWGPAEGGRLRLAAMQRIRSSYLARPATSDRGAADLRRLRRAPGRGSLCLCLQFAASGLFVRVFVCVFVCSFVCLCVCLVVCLYVSLFVSLVGWLFVSMCACLFFVTLQHNFGLE